MLDLTGQTFGRLTVIKQDTNQRNKYGYLLVLCRCICGVEKLILYASVKDGGSKSCGCLRREVSGNHLRTHGLSRTPLYAIWNAMIARCYLKTAIGYPNYGGRGIKVCERWLTYKNFMDDMIEGYKKGLTLERNDNDGDYCKENCRWATRLEQSRNKRNTIMFRGETPSEASRRLGLRKGQVSKRIKDGWPIEKAFNTPEPPKKLMIKDLKFLGETTVQASRRLGLSDSSVEDRIRRGWTVEEAFTNPRWKHRIYW